MSHRTLFVLALLTGAAARAQVMEEIPLRPPVVSNAPPAIEEWVYRNNNYDDRGFNRVVQQVTVPTLTVYHAKAGSRPKPALIVCPGGGYKYLAIDREGHALARYFSARGITVAVLKYRLPSPDATNNGLPLPQEDALAAIRFIRARAGEWGLDRNRVGILGCSAGGHLAGSAGILGDAGAGTRPDFVALLYPVVVMDGPHSHRGSRTQLLGETPTVERLAEFSLDQRAREGLPPFFLVHARDDKGVPVQNSELFAAALRAKDVPVELLLVASGGHGFGLGRGPESARWKDAFLKWLERIP